MFLFKKPIAILLAILMMFSSVFCAGSITALADWETDPEVVETAEKFIKYQDGKTVVYIGKTITLKISNTPDETIWKSSNKKIATVTQDGVVKGIKTGKVTITAIINEEEYSCTVTVKKPFLNKTKLTLKSGKTYTLKINGSSIKSVRTSNKKIATISKKGVVTAKRKGKATITITGTNKKKYTCKVKVNSCLSASKITLAVGDKKTVYLRGAKRKKTWSTKKSVASVTKKGTVTAKKKGTATIKVKDTKRRTYSCKVTVEKPSMSDKSITLDYGEEAILKLKGNTQTVTWTSDNTDVATVSEDGTVLGAGVGTAKICAKVKSGHKYYCTVTVTKSRHTVEFETKYEIVIPDQAVKDGEKVQKPDDPDEDYLTFKGWYADSDYKAEYDFDTLVHSDMTIYVKYEEFDTDGDGFSDYKEIYHMGTDINVPDNPNLDSDGDGLKNGEEVNTYNTDIYSSDTDMDGLTDYDEVKTYKTDPTRQDTDGDGLTDEFEVKNGFNPLNAKTDGVHNDADVKTNQELEESAISKGLLEENSAVPSVSGSAKGDISDNVYISQSTETILEENRSIIGKPVCVEGDDSYVSGLKLSFDLSDYTGSKDPLSIVKLNDEGSFEISESSVSSNAISCKINGSGDYSVLDVDKFLDDMGINIEEGIIHSYSSKPFAASPLNAKISGQADIVFAIDTTGSMSNAINNVIENVSDFSLTLSNEYNVKANYALVDFKDIEEDGSNSTRVVSNDYKNWYSNVDDFISKVRLLSAYGGGDAPESDIDALETSRLLDFRKTANKFVILITDDSYKIANNYGINSMQEEINRLKNDGICVSVVAPTYFNSTYKNLYETTGGIFANLNSDFASTLLNLASLIGEETSDGTWVILQHGYRYVKLPAIPTSSSTKDTDGDGLSDYKELGKKKELDLTPFIKLRLAARGIPFSRYAGKKTITVYDAISDPTLIDSDDDGINDKSDTAPWSIGLKGGIVGAIKICSYGTGPKSSGNFSGHAFIAYTSFIKDDVELFGINVTSYAKVAKEDDTRSDGPKNNKIHLNPDQVITIGGWAGWLPDKLKGTWINNELYNFNNVYEGYVPDDQRSLCKNITASSVEKMEYDAIVNSKWSELYNCSAYAVDMWNDATGDNISARGTLIFRNPASLSYNMEKRSDCERAKPLKASRP